MFLVNGMQNVLLLNEDHPMLNASKSSNAESGEMLALKDAVVGQGIECGKLDNANDFKNGGSINTMI